MPRARRPAGSPDGTGGQFVSTKAKDTEVKDGKLRLARSTTSGQNSQPPSGMICGLVVDFSSAAPPPDEYGIRGHDFPGLVPTSDLIGEVTNEQGIEVQSRLHNFARMLNREDHRLRQPSVNRRPNHPESVMCHLAHEGWQSYDTSGGRSGEQWTLSADGLPPGLANAMLCVQNDVETKWVALQDGVVRANMNPWGEGNDTSEPLPIIHAMVPPEGGGSAAFDKWSNEQGTTIDDPRPEWYRLQTGVV